MITLTEYKPDHYLVVWEDGELCGEIHMEENGFGYTMDIPDLGVCCFEAFFQAEFLRLIADTLDGMDEQDYEEFMRGLSEETAELRAITGAG